MAERGRIRTSDTVLPVYRTEVRCLRPLSHLSGEEAPTFSLASRVKARSTDRLVLGHERPAPGYGGRTPQSSTVPSAKGRARHLPRT